MKINVSYVALTLVTATYLITAHNMYAEGASLSIYPPIVEVQTTPPSSPSVPIVIHNNLEEDVTLQIQLIPFKGGNASGDIQLLQSDINKGLNPYIMKKIQFLYEGKKIDTVSLAPLESKEIEVNVNLTKGDPPGDFYYSMVFLNGGLQATDTSRAQIPTGIASNLLLSIGPKKASIGGISEFKTTSFKTHGPVEFTLRLHNANKHLILPSGNIEISSIFGQKVGNVKILPQYILAGEDRYLTDFENASPSATTQLSFNPVVLWPEKFLLGIYKAQAIIALDENGKPITSYLYFFAFPLYFFFPIVVIMFIAISIYLRVKKKI